GASMRRAMAAAAAIATLLGACTGDGTGSPPSRSPSASGSGSPRPSVEVRTGDTSALEAMERLCAEVDVTSPPVRRRPTPTTIAEVESQVEAVRGLRFVRRVNAEPITPQEMDRRLARYLETYYPKGYYARRSLAWRTIGALPRGIGYLEALGRYQQGQVLGFYNSQNEELVYTGDEQLTRIEQFILAHELTHAIDDQHFDLDRLDELSLTCDDERFQAALGVVEGSANHFATQVIFRFPIEEIGDIPGSGGGEGVPPMVQDLQEYPYTDGLAFVDALADDGGSRAIDRALRRFPTTTEEVLHPERFRKDPPTELDLPDFAPTFGDGWRDLDVMIVGELWLRTLLDTELPEGEASSAADGWDGGIYRAWTDGGDAAVILSTAWDTAIEAAGFREAIGTWARGRADRVVIGGRDTAVTVGFGSSPVLLPALDAIVRNLLHA
ncbi:MAG TPA: hypothetical protein VFQ40_02240, partial [Actinomycetota bacterium]|nr:hypothetical protein [Actinomycetota bacterium]